MKDRQKKKYLTWNKNIINWNSPRENKKSKKEREMRSFPSVLKFWNLKMYVCVCVCVSIYLYSLLNIHNIIIIYIIMYSEENCVAGSGTG